MPIFTSTRSRGVIVLAAASVLAVSAGTGAVAGQLITGKDIKNGTIESKDIENGTIVSRDIANAAIKLRDVTPGMRELIKDESAKGDTGPQGPKGDTGPQGPKGDTGSVTYSGANWSIVDRNVQGTADSYLRSGPTSGTDVRPPAGVGSLGIRTTGADDKAAFGNQVDFVGTRIDTLDTLGFSVFTTGENNDQNPANLPSLNFEVNPAVAGKTYSSLVFTPAAAASNKWTAVDATGDGWWFSNATVSGATGCTLADPCTWAEIKTAAPDATLLSVQFTKGRDSFNFSGAVDALQMNATTYDFEPFGVVETTN